jgi:hypothetical protein
MFHMSPGPGTGGEVIVVKLKPRAQCCIQLSTVPRSSRTRPSTYQDAWGLWNWVTVKVPFASPLPIPSVLPALGTLGPPSARGLHICWAAHLECLSPPAHYPAGSCPQPR